MPNLPQRMRFGSFVLDVKACRLTRDEVDQGVTPRQLDVLACLVRRPGALVTKEELIAAGWPDVAVSDNSLTQAISDLRQALGDPAGAPAYIQTVARRGYRFVAAVEVMEPVPQEQPPGPAPTIAADRPRRARETSSLEAARAFAEGRWRLEALEARLVPEAIESFERAIVLDPTFAAAHLGLANALFWRAEASRDLVPADVATLARAVDSARRAVTLEPDLAEAHATLGYVLAGAGQADEARAAAARAVALEPGYWGHHFRLGHASWGEARLRAHARALELYPDFAFAHLQVAMVFVARGDLGAAESALRQGLVVHERHRGRPERFPAQGLHWLTGLVLAARGEVDGGRDLLRREAGSEGRLYAREFHVSAQYTVGLLHFQQGEALMARAAFDAALVLNRSHARSLAGLAALDARRGTDTSASRAAAAAAIGDLERSGRRVEAALCQAVLLSLTGEAARACEWLDALVRQSPPGPAGWILPVEPAFGPLRGTAPFDRVLALVAERAR